MTTPLSDASAGSSLTPPRTSPDTSPTASPRLDPLTRLGRITIDYKGCDRAGGSQVHLVTGIFQNQKQQSLLFTQLLALDRAGVRKFNYYLNPNYVEFTMSDGTKADQFAERVNTIAKRLTPDTEKPPSREELLTYIPRIRCSPESSPHKPFTGWGYYLTRTMKVEQEEPDQRPHYSVRVEFEDTERQLVVRKDLDALFDAGVTSFKYSLDQPVVSFTFFDESKALAFMDQIRPQEVSNTFELDDSKRTE